MSKTDAERQNVRSHAERANEKPRIPRTSNRFRFSLRALLVIVTLLAIGLAAFGHWRDAKRREAAAAEWLLDHGASVAWVDGRPLAQRPLWVQRLGLVLPEECLQTVYWALFPRDTTDEELRILRDLPNLKTLHLQQAAHVTPAGLAPLAELTQLEVLDLKHTPAGDAGLAHMRELHGLKEIWIRNSGITDVSMAWIASNPGLTHLDLHGTKITDQGVLRLAALQNLEVLGLGDTPITSQCLAAIAGLPRLKHLYLVSTAIDDEGLNLLSKMKSLQTLDVRRTRVTAAGQERLKQALPQCRLEDY